MSFERYHPVLRVLSFKTSYKDDDNNTKEVNEVIRNINRSFYKQDKNLLRQIMEDGLGVAFVHNKIEMIYTDLQIKDLYDLEYRKDPNSYPTVFYCFNRCINWIYETELQFNTANLEEILENLLKINSEYYLDLAIDLFIFLIWDAKVNYKWTSVNCLSQPLIQFAKLYGPHQAITEELLQWITNLKSDFSEEANTVRQETFLYFLHLLDTQVGLITPEIFDRIASAVQPQYEKLECNVLHFFADCTFFTTKLRDNPFPSIAEIILANESLKKPLSREPLESEHYELGEVQNFDEQMPPPQPTFEVLPELPPPIAPKDVADLLLKETDQEEVCDIIVKGLRNRNIGLDQFLPNVLNVMKENRSNFLLNRASVMFLYIVCQIDHSRLSEFLLGLMDTQFFNPFVTRAEVSQSLPASKSMDREIHEARATVYAMIGKLPDVLFEFVDRFLRYPSLIVELFMTLSTQPDSLSGIVKHSQFNAKMHSLLKLYRDADISGVTKAVVEQARFAILKFLCIVFSRDDLCAVVDNCAVLIIDLMSFLYEPNIRGTALELINYHFRIPQCNIEPFVSPFTTGLISKTYISTTTEIFVDTTEALFRGIKNFLKKYANEFQPLITILLVQIHEVVHTVFKDRLLMVCLEMFVEVSNLVPIYNEDINIVTKAIAEVGPDLENDTELYSVLLSQLSFPISKKLDVDFVVRKPILLRLPLDVYRDCDRLTDVTKYYRSLITFSTDNAVKMHEGKIDEWIIDFIASKADKEYNIDSMVDLLFAIVNVITSQNVIDKLIDLLRPIDGHLSNLHPRLFVFLETELEYLNNSPVRPLVFREDSHPIEMAKSIDEIGQFAVSVWVSSTSRGQGQIWRFDCQGISVQMYASETDYQLTADAPLQADARTTFKFDLPRGTTPWFLLSVLFVKEDTRWYTSITVNYSFISKFVLKGTIDFRGDTKLVIGGPAHRGSIEIGPFGYMTEVCEAIIEDGPRYWPPRDKTIAWAVPGLDFDSGFVKFRVWSNIKDECTIKHGSQSTKGSECGTEIAGMPTIVDLLLCSNSSVSCFTLPFDELDMTLFNGQKQPFDSARFVSLLMRAMTFCEEVQENYASAGVFSMLRQSFERSDASHQTVELFQRFSQMCERFVIIALNQSLLRDIVFNIAFWMRAGIEVCERVCEACAVSVCPRVIKAIMHTFSVEDFLDVLLFSLRSEDPGENERMGGARGYVIRVMRAMTRERLTMFDLTPIVEAVCTNRAVVQTVELLELVSVIVSEDAELLKKMSGIEGLIHPINVLFGSNSIDVNVAAVRALGLTASKGVVSQSVTVQQELFMEMMIRGNYNTILLDQLLPMTQQMPEMLQFIFFLDASIGRQHEAVSQITPSPAFIVSRKWAFWAAVDAALACSPFSRAIFDMLVGCVTNSKSNVGDEWLNLYNTVCIATDATGADFKSVLSMFLRSSVSKFSRTKMPTDLQSAFIGIIKSFLFLQPEELATAGMRAVFESSCFDQLPPCEARRVFRFTRGNVIKEIGAPRPRPDARFGLRFNSAGEWVDRDLAVDFFELATKSDIGAPRNLLSAVAFFLLKSDPQDRKLSAVIAELTSAGTIQTVLQITQETVDNLLWKIGEVQSMLQGRREVLEGKIVSLNKKSQRKTIEIQHAVEAFQSRLNNEKAVRRRMTTN